MSDEPPEPTTSDQPTGPEGKDQQTQESPALSFPSPAGGPGAGPSELAAPPVTPFSPPAGGPGARSSELAAPPAAPPELWSSPASQSASAVGAFPVPELDKAPRVETVPAPEGSPSGGGFDANRVISVARTLAEKPEVLLGAAFGGGILLAIIIRRLGS